MTKSNQNEFINPLILFFIMNEIQIFQNVEFGAIRTMSNEQGEPMFCLKDVCEVLELQTKQVVKTLGR